MSSAKILGGGGGGGGGKCIHGNLVLQGGTSQFSRGGGQINLWGGV